MAAFWRGEITTRRLVALIKGLPEGSALHRAMAGGRTWTTLDAMIWHLSYLVERVETVLGAQGVQKKPRMPKKKTHPWDDDDNVRRTGRVDEGDQAAAVQFLMSKKPKPK